MFLYIVTAKLTMEKMEVNGLDLSLVRVFVALAVSLLLVKVTGASFHVPTPYRKFLFLRSLAGTIGFTTYIFAIKYLPLGLTMIIFNTAPFWATLLAYLALSEKLKAYELIAMLISFVGIVLIAMAKPAADPAEFDEPSDSEAGLSDSTKKLIGVVCIFITAWVFATVAVLTRMMQGLKAPVVIFYYAVLAVIVLTLVLLIETWIMGQPLRILSYSWIQLGMMVLISLINIF